MTDAGNLIDTATTSMLLETLEEGFYDVVQEFVRVGNDLTTQIQQLANDSSTDIDGLISLVHTLKGASGNIGATLLSNRCQELETQLHNRQLDGIAAVAGDIADLFAKTRDLFLQQFSQAS